MGETAGGVLRRGSDRILGGVCSGLGRYFGVDAVLVRVIFVILALVPPGIGIILYLVLWFLMDPPGDTPGVRRSVGDRFRAMGDDIREDFQSGFSGSGSQPPPASTSAPTPTLPPEQGREPNSRWRRRPRGLWAGIVLIAIGAYLLVANLGLLNWIRWDLFWPIVLIAVGVLLLVRRR
jgi:phage shock protein C